MSDVNWRTEQFREPPTRNPADCMCGGATSKDGFRYAIVCPCCDGVYGERVVHDPPAEKREDEAQCNECGHVLHDGDECRICTCLGFPGTGPAALDDLSVPAEPQGEER